MATDIYAKDLRTERVVRIGDDRTNIDLQEEWWEEKAVYNGYLYFSTSEDTVKKAADDFKKAFKKTGLNISGWRFHYTLRPEDAELFVEGLICISPFPGDDAFRRACEKQGINVDNLVRRGE